MVKIFNQYRDPVKGFTLETANKFINTQGIELQDLEEEQTEQAMSTEQLKVIPSRQSFEKLLLQKVQEQVAEDEFRLIDKDALKQCFLFSQMTVIDEDINSKKYLKLVFVEFLEMLCRVGIKACPNFTEESTIERKVHELIKILYQRRYETGIDDAKSCPIHDFRVVLNNEDDD